MMGAGKKAAKGEGGYKWKSGFWKTAKNRVKFLSF